MRSFGRMPVTLRSPQLTSASNRKYHGVIHIIITLTSLVCMLYVWSLLGLKTLKPECFFKLFKYFCFYFFCIQYFDTFDTFYKKMLYTRNFSSFDIIRGNMFFNWIFQKPTWLCSFRTWSYDLVFPVCKCVLHWFTCSVIHISWNMVTLPLCILCTGNAFLPYCVVICIVSWFFCSSTLFNLLYFLQGIEFSFSMYIP